VNPLIHLMTALPAAPAHCVALRLEADAWLVLKGLITLACVGFVVVTWIKTKGNLLPTIGAFVMAMVIFWGTVLGGIISMGSTVNDTMVSAGATTNSTDLGAGAGGC
jgi:hypothetical protein